MTTLTPFTPVSRLAAHRAPLALVPAGSSSPKRKRASFQNLPTQAGRHLDGAARATLVTAIAGLGGSTAAAAALMIGLGR